MLKNNAVIVDFIDLTDDTLEDTMDEFGKTLEKTFDVNTPEPSMLELESKEEA
jgi:hypothetical protein